MKCWWERNDKARESKGLQGYGKRKLVSYHYPLVNHFDMVNKKVKGLMLFASSLFLLGTVASLFLAWSAVMSWPREAFSQELKSPPSVPCPPVSHGMVLLSAAWLNIPVTEGGCVFQGLFTGLVGFSLSREDTVFMIKDLLGAFLCCAFKSYKLFLSFSGVTGSTMASASRGIHWLVLMLTVPIWYKVQSQWKAGSSGRQKNTLVGGLKEHSFVTDCLYVTCFKFNV